MIKLTFEKTLLIFTAFAILGLIFNSGHLALVPFYIILLMGVAFACFSFAIGCMAVWEMFFNKKK